MHEGSSSIPARVVETEEELNWQACRDEGHQAGAPYRGAIWVFVIEPMPLSRPPQSHFGNLARMPSVGDR